MDINRTAQDGTIYALCGFQSVHVKAMTTHVAVIKQDGVLYALCGFISAHDADFSAEDAIDTATCPPCRARLAVIVASPKLQNVTTHLVVTAQGGILYPLCGFETVDVGENTAALVTVPCAPCAARLPEIIPSPKI